MRCQENYMKNARKQWNEVTAIFFVLLIFFCYVFHFDISFRAELRCTSRFLFWKSANGLKKNAMAPLVLYARFASATLASSP